MAKYVYRHKTVSRFQMTGNVGEPPFDFKDFYLTITDEDRNARFRELAEQLHPRDKAQIVIVNAEALANLESSLAGSRAVRGAQDTKSIRATPKNEQGLDQMTMTQLEQMNAEQEEADKAAKALADQALAEGLARVEEERQARVAEEEAKLAAAGQIDDSAVKQAEANATAAEEAAKSTEESAAPAAGLAALGKKK